MCISSVHPTWKFVSSFISIRKKTLSRGRDAFWECCCIPRCVCHLTEDQRLFYHTLSDTLLCLNWILCFCWFRFCPHIFVGNGLKELFPRGTWSSCSRKDCSRVGCGKVGWLGIWGSGALQEWPAGGSHTTLCISSSSEVLHVVLTPRPHSTHPPRCHPLPL